MNGGGSLPLDRRKAALPFWAFASLLLALLWVYWPRLEFMVRRWSQDPQYTHGYVVPIFALLVLWFRREHFPKDQVGPCWWGLLLIVLGGCARMVGTIFSFDWLDGGSLLPSLVGVVLLCLGPAILLWSWPAFVLLLFVLPWPYQFDEMLTFPLRRIATDWSTFALQTLGVPALARGNVITIDKLEVGVVEACSGLGMLMTFFALSTAIAFVIRRPLADKIIIFLSAIPVGVLMNVVRITITVFLYRVASAEVAQVVFHDVAGWVMMPMAVGVMWLELCWLRRLWLTEEETGPVRVSNWENEFMASGGLPSPVTADPQEVHASRAPSLAESNYPLTAAPVNSGESL